MARRDSGKDATCKGGFMKCVLCGRGIGLGHFKRWHGREFCSHRVYHAYRKTWWRIRVADLRRRFVPILS